MTGVVVSACGACGWRGFPARLWCPRCGAFEIGSTVVDRGLVSQLTLVIRAVGRDVGDGVAVADVELEGGGSAIARADAATKVAVALASEAGVPVATPAAEA